MFLCVGWQAAAAAASDEVAAAMMQRLADVQEQNFALKQKIKALDETVRQRAGDCEQQRQIVAALGACVRLSADV